MDGYEPAEIPSSCDVSDACDELGLAAVRSGALRPVWTECPPLAGPIATVRLEAGTEPPLPALLDVLAASAGQLLLVDLGGRLDVQCWGSALATVAQQFGIRGALVNGAVRDVEGLRALRFATYARGVYPASMRGRLSVVAINEAVVLEDGTVEPGAFAVADASGAVFLPGGSVEQVLGLAATRRAREEEQLHALRAGADPRAVFRQDA